MKNTILIRVEVNSFVVCQSKVQKDMSLDLGLCVFNKSDLKIINFSSSKTKQRASSYMKNTIMVQVNVNLFIIFECKIQKDNFLYQELHVLNKIHLKIIIFQAPKIKQKAPSYMKNTFLIHVNVNSFIIHECKIQNDTFLYQELCV